MKGLSATGRVLAEPVRSELTSLRGAHFSVAHFLRGGEGPLEKIRFLWRQRQLPVRVEYSDSEPIKPVQSFPRGGGWLLLEAHLSGNLIVNCRRRYRSDIQPRLQVNLNWKI
jgi:hypothetical protein